MATIKGIDLPAIEANQAISESGGSHGCHNSPAECAHWLLVLTRGLELPWLVTPLLESRQAKAEN